MYFAVLLVFLVTVIHCHAAYFDHYDYCQTPCDFGYAKEIHIKCQRKGCEVDQSNCQEFEPTEMTDRLKQLILDEHNKLRNKVASGQETQGANGPQPQASNMMALKYNDELASVAQCWANTCQFQHSQCHNTKHLPWVGQSIGYHFSSSRDIYNKVESVIKYVINRWYEEVKIFNKDYVKPYRFSYSTGHYAGVVGADLQEIGCGIAKYKSYEGYRVQLVCNYGTVKTAANVEGEELYKIGQPCTACPEGTTCNSKYNALCGEDTLDFTGAARKHMKHKKTRKNCIKH